MERPMKNKYCIWCGKQLSAASPGNTGQEEACAAPCQQAFENFKRYFERWKWLFALGTLSGVVVIVVGSSYSARWPALGVLLLGITIFLFPFLTPQTVARLGTRRAILWGRIIGTVFVLLGASAFVLGGLYR
jgi:hypothetical protein